MTMETRTVPTLGIYELELVGPEAALAYEHFGQHQTVEVEAHPYDNVGEIEYRATDALCQRFNVDYDELPEECTPLQFSDPVQITNEYVNPDGTQAYFVTVYEIDRCYGGPEEGGWWYDAGEPIRFYVCRSHDEAQDVREQLSNGEFPTTGKRYSVLGGEDYSIGIGLRPGEAFPDKIPHYE
jgi:hypothetical protein